MNGSIRRPKSRYCSKIFRAFSGGASYSRKHLVAIGHDPARSLLELDLMLQIRHADGGGAVHLVGIARPDAALGGADPLDLPPPSRASASSALCHGITTCVL
jgi:hypothetical protein